MPVDLDPLSQLIGTQTAQIAGLASQITDLRSEVITNRSNSQVWRDEMIKQLELIHAELRNVKHLERNIDQDKIALDALLKGITRRLAEIEGVVLVWKTRATMIMAIAIAVGSLLSMIVKPLFEAAWIGLAG